MEPNGHHAVYRHPHMSAADSAARAQQFYARTCVGQGPRPPTRGRVAFTPHNLALPSSPVMRQRRSLRFFSSRDVPLRVVQDCVRTAATR